MRRRSPEWLLVLEHRGELAPGTRVQSLPICNRGHTALILGRFRDTGRIGLASQLLGLPPRWLKLRTHVLAGRFRAAALGIQSEKLQPESRPQTGSAI